MYKITLLTIQQAQIGRKHPKQKSRFVILLQYLSQIVSMLYGPTEEITLTSLKKASVKF